MTFAPKELARLVIGSYNEMIKTIPQAFGYVYKVGELVSSNKRHSPVYYANTLYASKLHEYLDENGFDTAISTHLYGAQALSFIRRKHKYPIRSYMVATDYTCIPFFEEIDVDQWIIPHESLRREWMTKSIPDEKIVSLGIPVKKQFRRKTEKSLARDIIGIPQDRSAFLIMSGGVGSGAVLEIVENLIAYAAKPISIVALVGRNSKLHDTLVSKYPQSGSVKAVVYTQEVDVFMDACDVLITKAGGLSTTEAAVKNIPIVHVGAIPGCETRNTLFFRDRGMSMLAENSESAARIAYELAISPVRISAMLAMQRNIINPNAAQDIVDLLVR